MCDSILDRITETEYDLSDRPCRIRMHENGQHLYTGEVAYDSLYGNLSDFTERVGAQGRKYKTAFGYDQENRPVALNYGSSNDRSTVTYDGLGRVSEKGVKVNGHEYTTAFAYAPGAAAGKTTGLISGITQTGENFAYTYDDVGNIASVTHNGKVTAYSYDLLGQLIRVNDQDDPTSGATGTTWTYEYDQGGNILSKNRYAYTEAADLSSATLIETDTFSYTDTNWRDKLTAYNGADIIYDDIGNPLNDGTWEYTWINGRQLASMSKIDGSLAASFVYNADGLRVQKTVNGVVTKYILHGKNITHLIRGNDELHFFYDASGSPAMVEWNNGTTTAKYAYVENLQGDIIAIINDNGAEVVKYSYDAWGTPVSTTGSMAATLGVLNPFRYRGYVYDEETGLYYLRSRYYSSKWCRFVNADSIINENVYTYCNENPIINVDSGGDETQTNDHVRKRYGPGGNYGYNGEFKKGTKVHVLFNYIDNNKKQWSFVLYWKQDVDGYGRYKSCYVMSEFLECSEPESSVITKDSNPFFIRTIRYGNIGLDVYNTQIMLCSLGLLDNSQCDGVYGKNTQKAIENFQRQYMNSCDWEDDHVDGLVGPKTKHELWIRTQDKLFVQQNIKLIPNG